MRDKTKYAPGLLVVLAVACLVVVLSISRHDNIAMAADPTPTPPDSNQLCRLEAGLDCTIINPLDTALSASGIRTHPAPHARNVPLYALVSIVLDRRIEPTSVTNDTFFVTQGANRVPGSVDYLEAGNMIVFQPFAPLRPDTTYTAALARDVRLLAGNALDQEMAWTFTTVIADGPGGLQALSPAETTLLDANLNIYFGDLHGHTGFSDGQGVPADAFTMARASGLDFYGLTEHAFMLDDSEWQTVLNEADLATVDGQFVALPGFEYSHQLGHINVFGSDTYVDRGDPDYQALADFYAWLVDHPTAIGQFNHPDNFYDFNFNDFTYSAAVDHKIVLQELTTVDQFFLSLNRGWHLGTVKNRDTHEANWGCCPLMGVLASSLTRTGILDGLATKRTFFVSPDDSNLAVMLQANGHWMGSAIPFSAVANFSVSVHDPDPTGRPLRLVLYDNGVPVTGTTLPGQTWYRWTPSVGATLGHYYYVGAYYDDWYYAAYSSPIWVERAPVASAVAPTYVAPAAPIELDGTGSWDPDGNLLLHGWTQTAGAPAEVTGAQLGRSAVTAPNTLGDLTFRLNVTDTGGLSDSDSVTVNVTDRPILRITMSAPATTEPGDPVRYTLTVTNSGVGDAVGVLITDTVPAGATYIGGGTLLPDNVVFWSVPFLAGQGGTTQHGYEVLAPGGLINDDYGATCPACVPAAGQVPVWTNLQPSYLPIIRKNQ